MTRQAPSTPPPSRPAAPAFAAVDLGATSGRVIVGRVGTGLLTTTEVHRFPNTPLRTADGLHWDVAALLEQVVKGLGKCGPVHSVGVDAWAVDYGLLDAEGALLEPPYHYRDSRTAGVAEKVRDTFGARRLYRANGLQHLPFNTIFQLAAAGGTDHLAAARTLLLIPDLFTYWLTGRIGAEVTNASTTGLLDVRTASWSADLAAAAGVDPALLPPLREPGSPAGNLRPHVARTAGLPPGTRVVRVASHDTASAVAAVPATEPGAAYISCGTWSLAGLELAAPVLTEESRAANFTNERGIDGTIRYLRNIMGMWLMEECRRTWAAQGRPQALGPLLAAAGRAAPFAALVDPDAPEFLAPADMPAAIAGFCAGTGQRVPGTPGAVVRCILESLALAHRRVLRRAAELAGREITRVHLVGGGSRNELLCQLTADATGLPVTAGPAEATALGNVLVQARAHRLVADLHEMRRLVAATQPLRTYLPAGDPRDWDRAAARLDRSPGA